MSKRDGIVLPEPWGYLLTWTTYGTWLPGDERGWVKYHRGDQPADAVRKREAGARMTAEACRLCESERRLVEQTVADHCHIRRWTLHAVNCRSNHVHVVVTASRRPGDVRRQLKAWTARRLNERRRRDAWWTERGSRRYLNDEASLEAAIRYVREAQ